jgi:chromosome segregation ATPase
MAQLDRMAVQLNAALDRLEGAAAPLLAARARAAKDKAEIEKLKQERDRLLARVALLENEAKELSGVTDQVEGRLDTAIAEIRTALAR